MSAKDSKTITVTLRGEHVGAVEAIAAQANCSQAEVMRDCLRMEIARQSPAGGADPYSVAAIGNLDALRTLRQLAINVANQEFECGNVLNGREALGAALVLSRLASEHGQAADHANLGGLLLVRGNVAVKDGETDFADELNGDGLAFLSVAADGGSQEADDNILPASRIMTPAAMARAKQTQANIKTPK